MSLRESSCGGDKKYRMFSNLNFEPSSPTNSCPKSNWRVSGTNTSVSIEFSSGKIYFKLNIDSTAAHYNSDNELIIVGKVEGNEAYQKHLSDTVYGNEEVYEFRL
jgi:hypothetical protein